ncbi:MAG TPA: MFS transporter [Burkholderiales bacterium]|nr:MFS transporter [Burkholderiales bacterium]
MRRDVLLLSLAAFASAASLRATDPLLPLIAAEYATTTGAASAAITGFVLSYGLLQVVYGPLGDRFGRVRTIAAASLVSAFGSAACALAPNLEALVAARLASGATIGALIPLALAWIGDSFPYEGRQAVLARFLIGQMLGLAFGTALAGWMGELLGWRSIFLAFAVLFVLIAAALVTELARNPVAARRAAARPFIAGMMRMPRLLAEPPVRRLLATVFAEGLLVSGAFAFVAVHLQQRHGVGPGLAGTLVAAYAGGGLLYAAVARRAVAALGERGLVGAGGAALALGFGGLAVSPWTASSTLCIAVVGVGFYMMHTTLQTHATQVAPEERGSAVALFAGALFLGGASGVWLAAQAIDAIGLAPVFAAAAIGLATLSFAVRRRLPARHARR